MRQRAPLKVQMAAKENALDSQKFAMDSFARL